MNREPGLDAPKGWLGKIIYYLTRRRFGKVLLPLKIHAHSPKSLLGMATMTALQTKPRALSPRLLLLGQVRVAALVKCPF